MRKSLAILIFILLASACSPLKKGALGPPNSSHLSRLYEETTLSHTRMGLIWIYCEAPDYHLVADTDEGFTCVDDVARALVFYCRQYQQKTSEVGLDKIHRLTEFLLFMQAENGFFYNFMLPGGQINKTHRNSQAVASWWSWRAFWALSELNLLKVNQLKDLQSRTKPVMDQLLGNMQKLCEDKHGTQTFDGIAIPTCAAEVGADQLGVMMMGLSNYYQINPSSGVKKLLLSFGNLLLGVQQGTPDTAPYGAFLSWQNYWHAWGNSQAFALLYTGRVLQHEPFIQAGLKEVNHFYPYFLKNGFIHEFKLVQGEKGLSINDQKQFPQIAYDIRPMIFAALEAFAITGDPAYAQTAGLLAAWFWGNNPTGEPIYDYTTGRCYDGIGSATNINRNSGAESTIEALLSLQAVQSVPASQKVLTQYIKHHKTKQRRLNHQ